MKLNAEQRASFEEAAKPLMKWLNDNANPHAGALVSIDVAELLTSEYVYENDEFVKD